MQKIKIILVILLLLVSCGCSKLSKKTEKKLKEEVVEKDEEKDFVEPYVDDNPITVGLYLNQSGSRTLLSTYESDFSIYTDILSLETYYTKEESLITGSQKNIWDTYYQNYSNIEKYKIGYHISFKTSTLEVNQTILSPKDVESFFDYIQIYLYDDIHQENGWYDHITEEEVTNESRFTSIKLTASTKVSEIISPVIITVFTYDTNDFKEDGSYRGNSSYQVTINRK